MSHKIQTLSGYFHDYQKSVLEPEAFWGRIAESFHWKKTWDKVLEWNQTEKALEINMEGVPTGENGYALAIEME